MAHYLRQSTASQEVPIGIFVDSTDGVTAKTALTIANTDLKIHKSGATALVNKNSGGATHMAGGVYYMVLDAADTDTIGSTHIYCQVSGALPCKVEAVVLAAGVYDQMFGSTSFASAATIATTVWDQTTSGHVAAGTFGGQVAEIGVAGAGLTNLGGLSTTAKAHVNAEVVDALNVDAYTEPGQAAPPVSTSLVTKIGYLYKLLRNKKTQTSTEFKVYADDGVTVDQKTSVSDDGTTATKGELITGP